MLKAPGPPINKISTPLESKSAPIYVIKTFCSFHSGCMLQLMHVYQPPKWTRENISDFCESAIFHVAFHIATINDTSGCVAFNYDYFCSYMRKISIMQGEMADNVMERRSELKC